MPRRLFRYLSMALSLGILCALIYQVVPSAPDVRKPAPKAVVDKTPPPPQPVVLAAVQLPPPPKPQRLKVSLSPLKPKPKKKPATSKPVRQAALKPTVPAPSAEPAKPDPPHDRPLDIKPDAKAATEGRTLLRLLEHGSGPVIEIAWPAAANIRERLYRHFRKCFGLRVAILAGEDRLFVASGAPGTPWRLNLDAFSGFMRQHGGGTRDERRELRHIRRLHAAAAGGAAVRIFPRHVDAVLLGGLGQIVGAGYEARKTIRATYGLRGGRVIVDGVSVDGRRMPGRIDLSSAMRSGCSI